MKTDMVQSFYDALEHVVPGGGGKNHADQARTIYLSRLSMVGLEDMYEYSRDPRLYQYFEIEPHKTLEDTRKYIQKLLDRVGLEVYGRKSMYWFVHDLESRKIIGSIGLVDIDSRVMSAAWGYAISPDYWGQGHIFEAQILVIQYVFETLGLNRLFGITMSDNEPTISSVLAAGFQQEGILRDYYLCSNGKRKDGLIYSMLAREYFAAKNAVSREYEAVALEDVCRIAAELFQLPAESFSENTAMRDIPLWNSLNHIRFIAAVEKKAGVKLKPLEIARATSIGRLLFFLNAKKEQGVH